MPARAEASLGLDEVLTAVPAVPTLVAEIKAELDEDGLRADGVICTAARHGNHWIYLGGDRAAPYECDIGNRTLRIEADRVYFGARGRFAGRRRQGRSAKSFREDNFRWTWTLQTFTR